MGKITIENLKGTNYLEFELPKERGVYLLAGTNGGGKTTLLVCLDRICHSMAFASGFSSSSMWRAADQYGNAKVTYTVNGKSVSYKKSPERWTPTPKKDSIILKDFGFSSGAFIKADPQRIAIKQDDLKPGNMISVDYNVKGALNEIFETAKFDQLMRLKNTKGRGKTPVFFYVIREEGGNRIKYYSEKLFSTGELAVVRLVETVEQVAPNSIVLLDEAEMALHPKSQVRLIDYLKKKAEEKDLWIFISTHSPTMLKEVDKDCIYLLKREEDKTKVINPCFPSLAIGEVDFAKSNIYDYLFFVEDERAFEILRNIIVRYKTLNPPLETALYSITAVGGFYETASLAVKTSRRVKGNSRVKAVLDQDAFEDLDHKPKFKPLFLSHREIIKSLTFTPEVWLIDQIEKADNKVKGIILKEFGIETQDIIRDIKYCKCKADGERKLAKNKYEVVLDILEEFGGRNREKVEADLANVIVNTLPEGEIKKIAGPLFS